MSENKNRPLIEVRDLKEYFDINMGFFRSKPLKAVDGVSFTIHKGETLGLVGESGCGKTTVGRTILHLYKPTAGEVIFDGKPIQTKQDVQEFRKKATMVFQDPYSSLNPRMTVYEIIAEPIKVCKTLTRRDEIDEKVFGLMQTVGLSERFVNAYPHELDGGRRQRIGVARALSLDPEFIVCDEPVSALDVSIQAQILNLMMDLQEKMNLTYVFITHDLSVVKHISDDIAVMYLGQCVEKAPSEMLFENPMHPYTQALLAAIPIPSLKEEHRMKDIIKGEVTSPINPRPGCRFAPRCPYASSDCLTKDPELKNTGDEHYVACIRASE